MVERPSINLPKIRSRGPLVEKVYTILKNAIISGKVEAGMWLHEEALTEALGVSRTPVREAFNRLKSEGFLEVLPRKGAHIIELSDSELDQLFEVREIVETTLFVRSARALPTSLIKKFRKQFHTSEQEMRESGDHIKLWNEKRRTYLKHDRAFHDTLIRATDNKYWQRLYFDIRDRIEIFGNQISFDQEWFDVAIADHYAILDSLERNDYSAGRKAMEEHIRNVRKGIDRIRQSKVSEAF